MPLKLWDLYLFKEHIVGITLLFVSFATKIKRGKPIILWLYNKERDRKCEII